jgi:hypothetical protein
VLFTLELNRRLGEDGGVQAFAADPGLVNTGIGTKGTPFWMGWGWRIWSAHGKTPEETAKGIVRVLLDPSVQSDAGIYRKYGLPVDPDPAALDEDSARRLWDISGQMCSLTPFPPVVTSGTGSPSPSNADQGWERGEGKVIVGRS